MARADTEGGVNAMRLATIETGLRSVNEDEEREQAERGRELADHMDRLGVSGHKLHRITGVARDTIGKARKGLASDRTYRVLEQALEDHEADRARGSLPPVATGSDVDTGEYIEVNLAGNFGITATVRGPVDRPDELQRMLSAILREMKGGQA